jgi:GT2 family glycosyltransferase
MSERPGIVVIGRNEGERLHRCIESLAAHPAPVVYVDSASSDDSVAWARSRVTHVVELDPGPGLSAARARNAGLAGLLEAHPEIEFVQFVDGDCRVQPEWIDAALDFLRSHDRAAVVCGRRREVDPDSTIYNRLADLEWDTPVGPANSCGGDAMMRVAVLREVGGYSDSLIAGEEPELCLRIRAAGYEVHRLPMEMTLHDAAITHFSQWWKRNARSGHASIELVHRHGRASGPALLRRVRSIFVWALGPSLAVASTWPFLGAWSLAWLGSYGYLASKVYRSERARGRSPRHARLYAIACCLGKFAELEGFVRFAWNRLVRGGRNRLIEYKGADA